ncbi:MAG: hypothetical protein KGN84_22110, partial [Acidobacteriota bacterium]|nr:hypothetical protein [Acidobacteriota bacterium]
NRKLLFWGDIAYHEPDLLKQMPDSFKKATIAVAWEYNPQPKGFDRFIKPFTDAAFETWVAPGVNNWSRVYPNWNNALSNIQNFTADGQRLGATGPFVVSPNTGIDSSHGRAMVTPAPRRTVRREMR